MAVGGVLNVVVALVANLLLTEASQLSDFAAFPVQTYSKRDTDSGRGAMTSVVYACNAGNEVGPCVETPTLCTSQGGKFIGYCFISGRYEGVCCSGLDPATATISNNFGPTPPSAPSIPPIPTAPTEPSSTTPETFDNSTTTRKPFPTFGTPSPNNTFTMPTASPNGTTTTQKHNSTFFTTQQMNFTMTTLPMPNMTTTTTTTTTPAPTTEVTTESTTTEVPPQITIETEPTTTTSTTTTEAPPADVPFGTNCGGTVTPEIQSLFQNPSYPSLDTDVNVYEYSVIPQEGYCALRIEFLEAMLAGKGMEGCSVDSVTMLNSEDSPTTPVCGLLQGFEWTLRQTEGNPIKIVITTQSSAYLWNLNITQIPCYSIKPFNDHESLDCGVKNPKPPPAVSFSPAAEQPKLVAPIKLLRSSKKALKEIMSDHSGPTKLMQNVVLNREQNIKIVRGNETAINEWPWQVLLMVNGRPLCGGSLLNEEWIITAGHCVNLNLRFPLVSVLTVDIGDHDLRTTKETKNVVARISKIIPNIHTEGVRNDIALIKLASKIQFGKTIRPVCLPPPKNPPSSYAGQTGMTTGWGRTEESVISPVLREASLPIISNERCRQQWSVLGEGGSDLIDNGMICIGGTGDAAPCNGDSGGPLVVQENSKWRLVGLTSFGSLKGCAVPGIPSVFTRMTSHLDWLALSLADT